MSKRYGLIGPSKYIDSIDKTLEDLRKEDVSVRIRRKDHTVWKPDPAEISNRLGWLDCPKEMRAHISEINDFVADIRDAGFTRAILLGMGGSSLAPEVFRLVFDVKPGFLDLAVLDSTHPDKILEIQRSIDPKTTLFIVSTKSGGTIETLSFTKFFYKYMADQVGPENAGGHFTAITDPASGLEKMAGELNFRKVFLNDPDIGGRFAALSYFGLVPAAFLGVDLGNLLDRAEAMAERCFDNNQTPGLWLGAALGELSEQGRDKLTFAVSKEIASFSSWVEQLVAESTGKEGKGILPVVGESLMTPDRYSDDRLFVNIMLKGDTILDDRIRELADAGHPVIRIELNDIYDLGAEFFRWEMATSVVGWKLRINPFDQPNVESAKVLAMEMITAYERNGSLPKIETDLIDGNIEITGAISGKTAPETLAGFLESGDTAGSYVAIQAYLKSSDETSHALEILRSKIAYKYGMAATVGYGPRFLHSTGQLHKGDGGNGVFIIITDKPESDLIIPVSAVGGDSKVSFAVLIASQASGDRQALINNQRRVIRIHFKSDVSGCLKRITEGIV